MSIFSRLGYDSANTATMNLSTTAVATMNTMPPLLNSWQTADVASSSASGYFVNPVANVTQGIWNTANSIINVAGVTSVSNMATLVTATNNVRAASNNFILHTNRISGVTQPNASTGTLPHYSSAMSVSKILMFITFQSDGVQNNAPMMGNFTSLTVANTLTTQNTSIQTYRGLIANSINVTATTDPETFETTYSYTTNLTPTQVSTMVNGLQPIADLMNARRTADVTFFNNSRAVVDDYNKVDQFSSIGQTESYLYNNYIGSDKLKSRINS